MDAGAVLRFSEDFVWGAATAAYQIEGSPLADGAGPSIWHRFAHTPGNVRSGDTGEVACDHYHRWREDVDLMRELGLRAYRFSIAWPRVLPEGTGAVNEAGIGFYDRLVDALCEAGVAPFVTLYHWDLPGALQDLGGWANRDCASWFADYAAVVFARLGDRVTRWITLNEPSVSAHEGYVRGRHAPGMKDVWAGLAASHHLNLAHAGAVAAFRASGGPGEIGITLATSAIHPASGRDPDVAAAARVDAYANRIHLDPLFRGEYPEPITEWFRDAWPHARAGDLEAVAAPIDFVGVNYYSSAVVESASGRGLLHARRVDRGLPKTEMGWDIDPAGLHDVLVRIRDDYADPAIYITENGAAFPDAPDPSGEVHDDARTAYIDAHLREVHRAISDGVRVRGYFVWSLLDNFEWAYGYSKRFGIVYVDYPTQTRTVKQSGRRYAGVIRSGGLPA